MEFTLIGAGHPATIVLMHRVAADLFGAKPRLGSSDVSLVAITERKRDRNAYEERLVSAFLEPSDTGGYRRIRNA